MPILDWLPTFVASIVFLGAAAAYLKNAKDKGTIDTLAKNNSALTERVELLEKDNGSLKARISVVEYENEVLRGLANSSAEIAALSDSLAEHHRQALTALAEHHEQAMEAWNQLHRDLGGNGK